MWLADDLSSTLNGLRGIRNLRGLVLTTPHKKAALEFVDSLGAEAQLIGSINAIRCGRDGLWHGENFDGLGCVRGLEMAGHPVSGRRVSARRYRRGRIGCRRSNRPRGASITAPA